MTETPARRRRGIAANVPKDWLQDPVYCGLSDAAWRLHTHALMWAIGRTDGPIPAAMLPTLRPSGDRDDVVAELVHAGVWKAAPDGWQVVNWEATQSTVAEIARNRANTRERVRRHRDKAGRDEPP